ncbi:MAG: cell envelope integrity EipB family protein [Parvibaculaceae bacterium]
MTIRAHRAVYDLELQRSSEGSNVSGADGRMVMELTGSACEGWSTSFRRVMEMRPTEGETQLFDNQVASWESGDGQSLQLNDKQFVNNRLESETKLKADMDADRSKGGKGVIDEPKAEQFELPSGALFPMAHQKHIMEAAERGETRDVSILYDGASGSKVYKVISFIGKRKEPGADKAADKALQALPSWPLSVTFYEYDPKQTTTEELPSYQMSFPIYENGVAGTLTIDYGDYVLSGKLTSVELLDQQDCK